MTPSIWITLALFSATNLIALAIGWARLSARLARIETVLEDLVWRPPQWCVDQQKECSSCFERREITGVGSAGHA
jgi:hypothetical protein